MTHDDRAGLYAQTEWQEPPLERPIGANSWVLPNRLELAGNRLLWWPGVGPMPAHAESRRGLLRQFQRLADAPDEAVLRFARRWAVLGVCRHGLPRCGGFPDW